jgi:hypothetical protein
LIHKDVCHLRLTTRLETMGMAWGTGRDMHLSQEGAAEFLRGLFIKQAQS